MSVIIILSLIIIGCTTLILLTAQHGKFWIYLNKISIVLLFLFLLVGFSLRFYYNVKYVQYVVLKNSIEEFRKEEGKLQSTFITKEIIDSNKELAIVKYLSHGIFRMFLPNTYINAKYLK